jgi:hypothetical protein
MVRCPEFYEKAQREGTDWCNKAPLTVARINKYLASTMPELEAELAKSEILSQENIPIGTVLSEGASRAVISEKVPEVRHQIVEQVVKIAEQKVVDGERPRVTAQEVEEIKHEITEDEWEERKAAYEKRRKVEGDLFRKERDEMQKHLLDPNLPANIKAIVASRDAFKALDRDARDAWVEEHILKPRGIAKEETCCFGCQGFDIDYICQDCGSEYKLYGFDGKYCPCCRGNNVTMKLKDSFTGWNYVSEQEEAERKAKERAEKRNKPRQETVKKN